MRNTIESRSLTSNLLAHSRKELNVSVSPEFTLVALMHRGANLFSGSFMVLQSYTYLLYKIQYLYPHIQTKFDFDQCV